jgi:hypothetical protein
MVANYPTRVGGGARALYSRRAPWPTYQSEPEGGRARWRLVVRGGDFSCEAETSRARQRLVVGTALVGNWSEIQPTGRRPDVLPVWVLTKVLSCPCPESWP